MTQKMSFLKATQNVDPREELTSIEVQEIWQGGGGKEVNLLIDTNVLIGMERVVKSGFKNSKFAEYKLKKFVKLLNDSPLQSISVSPGLALSEMPPQYAEVAKVCYEKFMAYYLPSFTDTPSTTNSDYGPPIEDYGFHSLVEDARKQLSISYGSFLLVAYVHSQTNLKPLEKLEHYIDLVEKYFDLISSNELEVAKFCYDESSSMPDAYNKLRKKVRENSVKKGQKSPSSFQDMQKIAFNAACDFRLLQAANIGDQTTYEGKRQDVWIATLDDKLASFNEVCRHVNLDGEPGKFSEVTRAFEQNDSPYWFQADKLTNLRKILRGPIENMEAIDFDALLTSVTQIESFIEANHVFN